MSIRLDQTLVFLGAGASAPAGIPTAREFITEIREHLARRWIRSKLERRQLLETYDYACAAVEKALIAAGPGRPAGPINVEQLYRALDDALAGRFEPRDALANRKPLLTPSRAIERLHYEVKRCIFEACWIKKSHNLDYLAPLHAELSQACLFPVVSLNYDNVIETFSESYGLRYFDPVIHRSKDKQHLQILKLHGSVTWAPGEKGAWRQADPKGRDLERMRAGWLPIHTPLIYPKPGKVPVEIPFVSQVALFQKLLMQRKRCVAIGYSFSDAHVVDWFASALAANPELQIILVNRDPAATFDSLVRNRPLVEWSNRVLAWPVGDAKKAFKQGLLPIANLSGNNAGVRSFSRSRFRDPFFVSRDPIIGIASNNAGDCVYLSAPGPPGYIQQFDLKSQKLRDVVHGLDSNRALAVDDSDRLFVVQNRLLQRHEEVLRKVDTRGSGIVSCVDRETGALQRLNKTHSIDRMIEKIIENRDKEVFFPGLINWPTDLVWSTYLKCLVATESRGIVRIDPSTRAMSRAPGHPLSLNIHAIDFLNERKLLALELGMSQPHSWGRVIEFNLQKFRQTGNRFELGLPRLFDLCVVKSKILITQSLPAPSGAILIFDYPLPRLLKGQKPRQLSGFDFPCRIVSHHKWNYVLCSDRRGLHSIPLTEIE